MGQKQHEDSSITTRVHHQMLSSFLGSKEAAKTSMLYSYKHGFSGFAAMLTKSQAELIAELPGVMQVIPNRIHKLHTTRSWDFLGVPSHYPGNLLSESNMGAETIIGVIDSETNWCPRFIKGTKYGTNKNISRPENTEFLSPRDGIGHGTHTASTAAGRFVKNASYGGLAAGVARGGATFSRLAVYKVCWAFDDGGCSDADMLKAFDMAIYDGVDILSVSIGIQIPLFSYMSPNDAISIGSFHATARGITVVCSAGNDGPFSQTIVNTAPWLITVAATTIDRAFTTSIILGNNHTLLGQSMDFRGREGGFTGLVYSERIAVDSLDDESKGCKRGSLNATLAAGKVVLCFSVADEPDIGGASIAVSEAGGVGLIYAQFRDNLLSSCKLIPCIQVDYEIGTEILSYIRKARSPLVKLKHPRTVVGKWVSPRVAYFSSRGPSSLSPTILKPDIGAPGVNILAAYPPTPSSNGFRIFSGTSMACPHVAGIAALIKSLHQNWSPAAIKSALITTAASQTATDTAHIIAEGATRKQADPFDIGGGHVDPNRAANPGLIYNMSTEDYVHFLCSMGYSSSAITNLTMREISCTKKKNLGLDLNLPSISIPKLRRAVTVSRTVTNVGPTNSVYKVLVQSPHGIRMTVNPRTLFFNSTSVDLTFQVKFSSTQKVHGDYSFGSLTWTDGQHFVKSSIVVRAIKFESYADM
ncbi:hypothetical protein AQUCO_01300542v1 [Aquilegia coerulea]|uniref:Uncharacterized protein n=1 Tax=Aquilegia coerulea TaxID=218851 RepID=A0A2G5E2V9_AQUCA|nr:hypothetical protein AQUCO_01300542v1 [Aquilegia coerulea]